MNYCIDCKWFKKNNFTLDFCRCPKLGKSLVLGEVLPAFAVVTRTKACGGDWFEAKPQEIKKKWWQFYA